jgi:hypothetical protein
MLLSILAFVVIAVLALFCVLAGSYCKFVFFGGPLRLGRTGPTILLLLLFAIAIAVTATTGGIVAGVSALVASFLVGLLG